MRIITIRRTNKPKEKLKQTDLIEQVVFFECSQMSTSFHSLSMNGHFFCMLTVVVLAIHHDTNNSNEKNEKRERPCLPKT
jgi:hypothetical protein